MDRYINDYRNSSGQDKASVPATQDRNDEIDVPQFIAKYGTQALADVFVISLVDF